MDSGKLDGFGVTRRNCSVVFMLTSVVGIIPTLSGAIIVRLIRFSGQ